MEEGKNIMCRELSCRPCNKYVLPKRGNNAPGYEQAQGWRHFYYGQRFSHFKS